MLTSPDPKTVELTPQAYRIPANLPASGDGRVIVVEEQPIEETIRLLDESDKLARRPSDEELLEIAQGLAPKFGAALVESPGIATMTELAERISRELAAIGAVEPSTSVAVRAQITGELTSVNFKEGDDVVQGQVLFTLDRRPLEAALKQAEAALTRDQAQLANATAQAQRARELAARGIATREQVDTTSTAVSALEATVGADRAAIENATVQLQYATIKAPISGRTGVLMVHPGNLVRANDATPLVVINQVTKNDERQGLYGLSTPYTISKGVIATRADDSSIASLADLKGRKSAQSLTSNWAQVAKDAGAKVEGVEGFTQAVTLLKQKRVDATVNDNLAVLDYQKSTGDTSVKIAARTGDVSEQVVATRKDSDLVAAVNKALADLKADGTLKTISEKYFQADVSVKQ